MMRGPDAGTLLRRALEMKADAAGCPITIVRSTSSGWHSATFAGDRHTMTFYAKDSATFATFVAALPDAEFVIRGQYVADCVVVATERRDGRATVTIEALTLVEG